MYKASMSQDIVKKKAEKKIAHIVELTEMQRRFCEQLIMNEGRITRTAAAIAAGYAEKYATQEAAGLIRNPKIQKYLHYRLNEVNRGLVLTRVNYLKRQYMLSAKIEREEKASKTAAHEALIGKAGGLFIETRINASMNEMDLEDRMKRIKELKEIQKDRTKLISES